MKKLFLVCIAALSLVACSRKQPATPAPDKFPYMVDQFYDLGILRYRVPDFESLTLDQKLLTYYLTEAALWGRDILFDQNCRYNLRIRRACEALYEAYPDKGNEQFQYLELYLKRVWFSNGIHHHYSEDKFLPEFTEEWFVESMDKMEIAYDPDILPVMFDASVMAKKVCQDAGVDLLKASACNYYEGLTQSEAEAWYAAHKDTSTEPKWIGLNSKLQKMADGAIIERVYKADEDGLYHEALQHVVENLEMALPYAENEQQAEVIRLMIAFNRTGDLETFNKYAIAWVKDLDSRVDYVNGFTEVYGDPLGITGAWESMVNFKNLQATERTRKMSDNAQWFEDNSPTDKRYKKAECKGVSAKVITASILAGDCYPSTPIGINLPNANWIRKAYGSKSVTIQNLTEAYNQAALGNGFNEEFMLSNEECDRARKYGALTGDVHVDLHECLGHGSGQLLPGITKDDLKEHGSTIEEARADLFSLYYMADPKLVELGIMPDADAYKTQYYSQMMNGALTQLVRVELGKNIEESHMRDRALIANWVLAHADSIAPEVEIVVKDNKHYVRVNDYEGMRVLLGQLLAIVQETVSTGDYARACELVETYAVKVNPTIHAELLNRYAPLNIAPYKGFVNPVYTLVRDLDGDVTDVAIDYGEGYIEQHQRYSRDYSPLPSVND